jgi:parvulin-like peptidyl-prolyl isomerase
LEETSETSRSGGEATETSPETTSAEEIILPESEETGEPSISGGEVAEELPVEVFAEESLTSTAEEPEDLSVGIGEVTEGGPGTAFGEDSLSPTFPVPISRSLHSLPPRPTSKLPLLIAVILALIVGLATGGLLVRQRYKAREVVVAVNGAPIDQADFYRRLESQTGDVVIRKMVGEALYLQFARKLGKAPKETDVEAKLQDLLTQPDFQKKLVTSHLSLDDIRQQLRSQVARESVLTKDVPVTEAEAHHFYEVNTDPHNFKALFYTPESAAIEVIIDPDREECDKASRAIQNGVPFENAVAVYSRDATRITGGRLPPILRGRTTSGKFPELEQAIFSLRIGGVVGPIKVAGSWWLIRCLDRAPAAQQTYAQVKEQCYLGAALSKLSNADAIKIERDFVDFQRHATVQAFWTRYTQAVDLK